MLRYYRIQSIKDQYFPALHALLAKIFPAEEVLAFEFWEGPLEDPTIHVYVALNDNNEVVGSTEYRYYPHFQVAMTDFTIIGEADSGVGRFLYREREKDLLRLEQESNTTSLGMFAEVYNPYLIQDHEFGQLSPMNPFVRREVLSHLGYKKICMNYLHPSWDHEGKAVSELDLCFLPRNEQQTTISAKLVRSFLEEYYAALPNKPANWWLMIEDIEKVQEIELKPI